MADLIKVIIDGVEKEVYLKDDVVTKADFEKIQQELEDTRLEVLTPQYDKFLKSLESGGNSEKSESEKAAAAKAASEMTEEEFKGKTPKQIFDMALAKAREEIDAKLTAKDGETKAQESARVAREIRTFAEAHKEDYATYRPIMHSLSLDPKNEDLNINQLYEKAKDYVKSIQTGSSEAEKNKSRRTASEKPGGNSEAFAKLKSTSNEEIAREAFSEVSSTLGPIPPA